MEVLGGVHHLLAGFRRPPGRRHLLQCRPMSSRQAACQMVTRMASVSMQASAARSMAAWNETSGRLNCWRSLR